MVIMGTNICPEPKCTNMRLSIRTTKQYPYDLNTLPADFKYANLIDLQREKRWRIYSLRFEQLIVDSEGLVTMFSLCLMDLSYLILKETTADHRTVRTQHILERTHNDDEF